jgi:hypothetical protein
MEGQKMSDESWYYVKDGKSMGPFPGESIKAMLKSDLIPRNTLVWKEGMSNWIPISEIEQFLSIDQAQEKTVTLQDNLPTISDGTQTSTVPSQPLPTTSLSKSSSYVTKGMFTGAILAWLSMFIMLSIESENSLNFGQAFCSMICCGPAYYSASMIGGFIGACVGWVIAYVKNQSI